MRTSRMAEPCGTFVRLLSLECAYFRSSFLVFMETMLRELLFLVFVLFLARDYWSVILFIFVVEKSRRHYILFQFIINHSIEINV
ncbi:MAG: hypothetical protein JWL88_171 [Parcubacteria group bacterium]|nr:hypothetical protein [Parcubacteria group bacterium]